jgi:hypothetical protein
MVFTKQSERSSTGLLLNKYILFLALHTAGFTQIYGKVHKLAATLFRPRFMHAC